MLLVLGRLYQPFLYVRSSDRDEFMIYNPLYHFPHYEGSFNHYSKHPILKSIQLIYKKSSQKSTQVLFSHVSIALEIDSLIKPDELVEISHFYPAFRSEIELSLINMNRDTLEIFT